MNKIDGVTILGLEIKLYGEIQEDNQIDLGALTLRNGSREYILDTVQSNSSIDGGFTTIDVKLEKDEEIFSDCKYDLIATDFMNLNGEFYISSDLNVETITLFVKFDGGLTQAIDIKIEE
jgi:hypothetical protein